MNNMPKPVLYYIYDPMCSWCWGYKPTWDLLQKKLERVLNIQSLVGGLAPDSNVPMPEHMQNFLQQIWRKISCQLGTEFNFDFWSQCNPKRSTYPSCRAVLVARHFQKEQEMCLAIQEAYYLHAKNPSDINTLVKIADSIGLDSDLFEQQINSKGLKEELLNEIKKVRQMSVQSFPSLVLAVGTQLHPIRIDYKNWQTSHDVIVKIINQYDA